MLKERREIRKIKAKRIWKAFWRGYRLMKKSATCGQEHLRVTFTLHEMGYPWSWCRLADIYVYDVLASDAMLTQKQRHSQRRLIYRIKRSKSCR